MAHRLNRFVGQLFKVTGRTPPSVVAFSKAGEVLVASGRVTGVRMPSATRRTRFYEVVDSLGRKGWIVEHVVALS